MGFVNGSGLASAIPNSLNQPRRTNHQLTNSHQLWTSTWLMRCPGAGWQAHLTPLSYPTSKWAALVSFLNGGSGASLWIFLIVDLHSPMGFQCQWQDHPRGIYPPLYYGDQGICSVSQFCAGALMAKFDVESAYRNVLIHPSDRYLLGTKWRNHYYIDLTLPFGLFSAPFILKRQCHKDFAVLGQFWAKIITLRLYS